jgi:hypothetical protein
VLRIPLFEERLILENNPERPSILETSSFGESVEKFE